MRTHIVKMIWDDGIWYTSTDEDLGITLESDSFDKLVERVRMAAPEMLELNCNYTGDFKLIFETIRVDEMKVAV